MKGQDLIDFILENDLENYEILIQDIRSGSVPLEVGDMDWNEDMEKLYLG